MRGRGATKMINVESKMDQIPFEDFREEWLAEVREGSPSTTELGHRFARKILTQWLDIDDDSENLVYTDGPGDGGFDIAYLLRTDEDTRKPDELTEGDIWYLVQAKYGTAFAGVETLLIEGQKVITTLGGKKTTLSKESADLLEKLQYFMAKASPSDHLVLVIATERPLTENEKDTLEDLRTMGRGRFGSIFDVEAISIETIYQRTLALNEGQSLRVPLEARLVPSGNDLLVGSISLLSLYAFLKEYRNQTADLDRIYEKNVRRFLGVKGKINKAISKTLQDNPERFGLYNNGVTIVVEDFDITDDGVIQLEEPYIVNGCQTTRSIWEVFHNRLETGGTGSNPALDAWRQQAGQGVVVTKIVKVGTEGEKLLQDITRYTNSQNAVREKDFLALTNDFRNWAIQMEEKYGVFLETQRGAWDSRRALQKQKPGIRQFQEHANAFDLLKVFGAGWLGEAGTAYGRNLAFLPNGAIFKRIMNSENGGGIYFGVDDLYAAYRLQRVADDFKFGRGAPQITRRQTRFLFYMIVGELLEDILVNVGMGKNVNQRTSALIKLFSPGNEEAANKLMDFAVKVVDDYLTEGKKETVFLEPVFKQVFNNDLNGFLKSEQLGKNDEATPLLRSLISTYSKLMGFEMGGEPSAQKLITDAILGS